MNPRLLLTLIGLFLCSYKSIFAQTAGLDSMAAYAKIAKPGWDQIDVAVGLGRVHIAAYDLEFGKQQITNLYQYADEHNIPSAKSYALILENLVAYMHENDADKAIRLCEEAVAIARETGNKDALVYAGYQLAENHIYEKGDNRYGVEILEEMLVEIDETVSLKNQGHVHKNLGAAYGHIGEYEKGIEHFLLALEIFEVIVANPPIDSKIGRVSSQFFRPNVHLSYTLDLLGGIYLKKGEPLQALKFKEKALVAAKKSGVKVDISHQYYSMGRLHTSLGNYKEALSYVQEARLGFEQLSYKPDMAACNNSMVGLYMYLKDYKMAEKRVIENLVYYKDTEDELLYARSLLQMVNIQLKQGNLQLAEKYQQELEKVVEKLNGDLEKAMALKTKGELALAKKQFAAAVNAFQEANQIYATIEDDKGAAHCQYSLAKTSFQQNQYSLAADFAHAALQLKGTAKDKELMTNTYLLLSDIYDAQGDYKKALENYKTFFAFSDSTYTADAQAKLKEEQVRQEVFNFKKEKELAEQNASLLAERNKLYITAGVILLGLFIIMGFLYVSLRKTKSKLQLQNTQLSQHNQTKDKFFGIIAHDLRSPLLGLQNIGGQIDFFLRKDRMDKLKELSGHIESSTKKLTDLLDNLLNWALLQNGMIPYQPEKVSIKEEAAEVIALLQPLADMKGIRLVNDIVSDTFVYADGKAVNTILRNIISNALKFTKKGGEVKVAVKNEAKSWAIMVNDTGTGISAEQLPKLFELNKKSERGTVGEKGTGLGLVLCKELVELNKGQINVESNLGKGSCFIFTLPNTSNAA